MAYFGRNDDNLCLRPFRRRRSGLSDRGVGAVVSLE